MHVLRMRHAYRPLLSAVLLAASFIAQAEAEPVSEPNYTTQNLIIYNEQGQVLLQRNFMGWSTPGWRYDDRVTLTEGLHQLAGRYGVKITDLRLAGLFTYRYTYTPAMSTRSHYSARLASGTPKAPQGFEELRWFSPSDAVAAIGDDSQRSPQALVQLNRQMLENPETIWGGAFHIRQEDERYLSEMTEPFHAWGGQSRRSE